MVAVWTGAITFGLVTIGCTLHRATRDRSVSFHQIHQCGGRIRYRKFCERESREVPSAEISSAYDYAGRLVPMTDDDLDNLPLTSARQLEIQQFVPIKDIDPVAVGRAYYVHPEPVAERAYTLLRDVLAETDRAALGTLTLRGRERLTLLRQEGSLLVAHLLYWPDEINPASDHVPPAGAAPHPNERQMARTLVEAMSGDLHPEQWRDRYREAVEARIADKLAGRPPEAEAEAVAEPVSDLEAALRKSINEARTGRKRPTS
ncbi:Ku protein [Saccharopolyspora shandongensis]|uniref:non-homologous end joining protein Ku n=1 Tax=Saccharopolyspora shandongensis TaxID=418495 RepID=UPI00343407E8